MPHYIALIHKDSDTGYGVSFPDVPGVTTVGDTIDDAMHKAAHVLAFAAEDYSEQTGRDFPTPRTIHALHTDRTFQEDAVDAVVALVPFRERTVAAK